MVRLFFNDSLLVVLWHLFSFLLPIEMSKEEAFKQRIGNYIVSRPKDEMSLAGNEKYANIHNNNVRCTIHITHRHTNHIAHCWSANDRGNYFNQNAAGRSATLCLGHSLKTMEIVTDTITITIIITMTMWNYANPNFNLYSWVKSLFNPIFISISFTW